MGSYEAGDSWLISYIFMRRSNIATERGERSQGVGLTQAALRDGAHLGPKLKALILRQQAGALTLTSDEYRDAQAIDEALISLSDSGDPEPLAEYCTPSYVQMEAAAAWTTLGRPDKAVDPLSRALDTWSAADQRDRGIARLATAHAMEGNPDAACATAKDAASLIQAAPSARVIGELTNLRTWLGP